MFRDGALVKLTRDHTLVQSLVDEGRITEQEAAIHPRRSWLVRTLQDGSAAEPDLFVHDAVVGDRFLICSDGLTAVLDDESGRGAALSPTARRPWRVSSASPTRAAGRTTSRASSRTSSTPRPRRRNRSSSAPPRRKASPS